MICPYCKTEEGITKKGTRKNKYVKKPQFRCTKCKRTFVERDGFEDMTYPKEIIVKALHLIVSGLSLSKTRDYIYQHEGYYLYDGTMLYWQKKYTDLISKFEQEMKPKVKGRIHTDEIHQKVNGETRFAINSIDSETKYNLGITFTKSRSKSVCKGHFRRINHKIGEQVKARYKAEKHKPVKKRRLIKFVSDGFEGYRIGFNAYFYRYGQLKFGVPIGCKKYGLEHNNNAIERHNEDIRQRTKVMRGFKSDDSGAHFLKLRRHYYNFVRPHQGLGKTPAEEAELNLNLGKNKFLNLIFF